MIFASPTTRSLVNGENNNPYEKNAERRHESCCTAASFLDLSPTARCRQTCWLMSEAKTLSQAGSFGLDESSREAEHVIKNPLERPAIMVHAEQSLNCTCYDARCTSIPRYFMNHFGGMTQGFQKVRALLRLVSRHAGPVSFRSIRLPMATSSFRKRSSRPDFFGALPNLFLSPRLKRRLPSRCAHSAPPGSRTACWLRGTLTGAWPYGLQGRKRSTRRGRVKKEGQGRRGAKKCLIESLGGRTTIADESEEGCVAIAARSLASLACGRAIAARHGNTENAVQ